MNKNGRTGWIIGVIVVGILCLFMLILFITVLSETGGSDGPSMSVEEMSAHCYRASELFCAGIYYTDKALTADPEKISYDEWTGYVDKAEDYWDALDYELDLIKGYAGTEGFQKAFDDTQVKASFTENISNTLFPTAYAIDTEEIMRAYNGAEAGQELQAVADYLGRDKEYAESALKVAKGELDSQKWSDVADAMYVLETGARVAKNVAQATAVVASAPYATGALATSVLVVNGASCMWQAVDDVCYVFMADDYHNSEFVANLGKVSDFVAPAAFVGNMLTMNFTGKEMETVLASYTFADTLRSALLDDKFAGIQLNGPSGSVVSMTKDEMLAYQQALKDGQSLPDEIEALLKTLEGDEPDKDEVELPEFKVTADKPTVMVEEWVAFTVQDVKPKYTYVWEYGGNKNPQDTPTFSYMYQVAGTYTMYVTILDADGEAIGRGSCSVKVTDLPTSTPNTDSTPEPYINQDTVLSGVFFAESEWDHNESSGYRYTRFTFDGNGNCIYEEYKDTYSQTVVVEGSESNYDKRYNAAYELEEKSNELEYIVHIYYTDENGNEMDSYQYVYADDMDGDKIVSFWRGDIPKVE